MPEQKAQQGKNQETIAMLGLGSMGSRMATRLLDAEYPLHVFNRSEARANELVGKGAQRRATPREAAHDASLVISCVRDDQAARAVWLDPERGALHALEKGSLMIESSTLTPECVCELAEAAASRGVAFLEAPVVGSRPQAEAGRLIYLVGGEEAQLARARPILEQLGGAIHHVGPVGTGAVMKLTVNGLFALQVAGLAELLALLDKSDIDRGAAWELLSTLPVTSPVAQAAGNLMLKDTHAPMFPIELVGKDLDYIEQVAKAAGASLPTMTTVRDTFHQAVSAGHAALDITGVARLFAQVA